MLAIIFAFVTFFTWGTGDIFATIVSRKIGAYNAAFYGYFFGFVIATAFIPFALKDTYTFSLPMILLTIFLAIIQFIAFYAYNVGIKIGNASLVGTISGAFTSIVVVLSVIFLGERLLFQQVIAIVIIFIGLFFASINISELKNKKSLINKGTVYAFIAMIGWAIYFTFIKIPVKEAGFFWPKAELTWLDRNTRLVLQNLITTPDHVDSYQFDSRHYRRLGGGRIEFHADQGQNHHAAEGSQGADRSQSQGFDRVGRDEEGFGQNHCGTQTNQNHS